MAKFNVESSNQQTRIRLGNGHIVYSRSDGTFRIRHPDGKATPVEIEGPLSINGPLAFGSGVYGESGSTAQRPTDPTIGTYYFDTDLSQPIWFDGTDWIDALGNPL